MSRRRPRPARRSNRENNRSCILYQIRKKRLDPTTYAPDSRVWQVWHDWLAEQATAPAAAHEDSEHSEQSAVPIVTSEASQDSASSPDASQVVEQHQPGPACVSEVVKDRAGTTQSGVIELDDSGDEGQPMAVSSPPVKATTNIDGIKDALMGLTCEYPPGKLGAVEVNSTSLETLEGDNYVDDAIMDFRIKVIQDKYSQWRAAGITAPKIYFFGTLFFKKLTETGVHTVGETAEQSHERVREWTKDVDLFGYDYFIVPIHGQMHWSLAIVCHPGNLHPEKMQARSTDERSVAAPVILHLDPLRSSAHDTAAISLALREYLRCDWNFRQQDEQMRKRPNSVPAQAKVWQELLDAELGAPLSIDELNGTRWDEVDGLRAAFNTRKIATIPMQPNYHDCGLYTLAYVENFAYRTPLQVLSFRGEDGVQPSFGNHAQSPNFLQVDWFTMRSGLGLRHTLLRDMLDRMVEGRPESDLVRRAGAIRTLYTLRYYDPSEAEARHEEVGNAAQPASRAPVRKSSRLVNEKLRKILS